MFPIFAQYSYSLPEMPPHDLLLLSLSTAAWIAAVTAATAALTLWRSKSHAPPPPPTPPPLAGPTEPPQPIPPAAEAPIATCHVEGALGSPRSRFTVTYSYDDDGECHVDGGDEESGEDGCGEWEVTGPRWMGVRGDLGWYRYQDRTAIDGSVVRLWGFNGGLTARKRRGLEDDRSCKGIKGNFLKRLGILSNVKIEI